MDPITLDGKSLTLAEVSRFMRTRGIKVELADEAVGRVAASRATVEEAVRTNKTIYGITTGFGRLAEKRISASETRDLQRNLIRSHCAGVGGALAPVEARVLMLLRANALAKGFSGVRIETLQALIALINSEVCPIIPAKGSVGASGDLAPLAALTAVLIGEGKAWLNGVEMPGDQALLRGGLEPVTLEAKEGLSLINGTQLMLTLGARALIAARSLLKQIDVIAAMSIDALLGTDAAFDARIHAARPHTGQRAAARNLRNLLFGSEIRDSHRGPQCKRVQDAYSLRCAPQVHGAVRDALEYVEKTIVTELNAATDNPLVFPEIPDVTPPENGYVVSGGNFHGAPVALALDVLAVAMAQLGTISERRIERLVNPDYSDLAPFLSRAAVGLNSGFMMAQVTAAALVSENKVLAHPASVDTIPTSAGFEDHVSMGPGAARKAREVVANVEHVAAIELLCAAQAIEFRRPLRSSDALEAAHASIRGLVPALDDDRPLTPDIEKAVGLIRSEEMLRAVDDKLRKPLE